MISLDPKIWGPKVWDLLFFISLHVDLNIHIELVRDVFFHLNFILPCESCQKHFLEHRVKINPFKFIHKSDKLSAAEWVWMLKDMVNQEIGKSSIEFSLVYNKYISFTPIFPESILLDLCYMLWMSTEDKKSMSVFQQVLKLISTIQTLSFLKNDNAVCNEAYFHTKHNEILVNNGKQEIDINTFKTQYKNAVKVVPKKINVKRK